LQGNNVTVGKLTGNGLITNGLHRYQIDNGHTSFAFNNTLVDESEDNWVGNVFTAAPGGTVLQSISFYFDGGVSGDPLNTLPDPTFYVALYIGEGAGMVVRAESINQVAVSVATPQWITIPFATPQIVAAGQLFTAAVLVNNVPTTIGP